MIFYHLILKFISIFIELKFREDQEIQSLDNSRNCESGYDNSKFPQPVDNLFSTTIKKLVYLGVLLYYQL